MKLRSWPLIAFLLSVLAAPAHAHYLFIRITPPAEGGRAAEVYFSERAEAGDPRFIEKVASTRLWLQQQPGEFRPLEARQASDRLRAALPGSGSLAVVGVWDYGVLARPGQTPFLLLHYPKAVAGAPAELNRLLPRPETPLEIVATIDGDKISFIALCDGQPMPDVVFHTVDDDLANEQLQADGQGRASWTPPAAGNYSVYVQHVRPQQGQSGGQSYDEVREFATLNFNWPLLRTDADPQAVSLFEDALAARAVWREFPGFSARVTGHLDGRAFAGKVTVAADGAVQADIDDEAAKAWVEDQLASLAMHRGAGGRQATGATRPTVWFADRADDHPLGRLLVFEGGEFASSYRVKDRQLTVVNRQMGEQNMTITVLDNVTNADGLFLPHSYIVTYWDAATGRLDRSETVQDRWQRTDRWDLPLSHSLTVTSELGLSVRTFALSELEIRSND